MFKYIFSALFVISITFGCSSNGPVDPLVFCEKFIDIAGPDAPLNNYEFNNPTSVDQAIQDLEELATEPPDQIAASTKIVVDLYKEILEALVSSSPDDRPTVLLEFQAEINEQLIAIEELENYGQSVCGINFEAESPTPSIEIPLDLND